MKIQVPVLGGLRKKVSIQGGTNIAGYGSLTLAQLATLLGVVQPGPTPPNTIGTGNNAFLTVGPGLTGGGGLIGNVKIGLSLGTLPGGASLYDSDNEDYGMMLSLPGPVGLRGQQGFSIPGLDGEDGMDGFPGIPGLPGGAGAAGAQGIPGFPIPGLDGEDGLDGFPGIPGLNGAVGPPGPAGSGSSGASGMMNFLDYENEDQYFPARPPEFPGTVWGALNQSNATGAGGLIMKSATGIGIGISFAAGTQIPGTGDAAIFTDGNGYLYLGSNVSAHGGEVIFQLQAANAAQITGNGSTFFANAAGSGVTLTIDGSNLSAALKVNGGSTSGDSLGALIAAGTTSADYSLRISNPSTGVWALNVFGDGGLSVGPSGTADTGEGTVNVAKGYYIGGAPLQLGSHQQEQDDEDWSYLRGMPQGDQTINGQLTIRPTGSAVGAYGLVVANYASGGAAFISLGGGGAALASTDFEIGQDSSGIAYVENGGAGGLKFYTAGANLVLQLNGQTAPTVQGWGPNAAALVDMTPDSGTFTGTLTGVSTTVTGVVRWARRGNLVTMIIPAMTGTSNAATCTMTGIPAIIQTSQTQQGPLGDMENATVLTGTYSFSMNGAGTNTMTFYFNGSSSGFTASGTKGFSIAQTVHYLLN